MAANQRLFHCRKALTYIAVALVLMSVGHPLHSQDHDEQSRPVAVVSQVEDFEVNGRGNAAQWKNTDWIDLNQRDDQRTQYKSRFKVLYSRTGIYFLLDGTDSRLTASLGDFDDLWTEDVYEFFLWTDDQHSIYFEYEISPLNKELPILIPNVGGQFLGWRPWHYEGQRKTRKEVFIRRETEDAESAIVGWSAEVFVPFELLKPLGNVPPEPGSRWRANVYRMDHDTQPTIGWDWSRVGKSFHEFQKFGTFVFE
ncbi:MAG: carbohydrate-binding family 9-like protein [Planctomycetales bacterium]|nr:carbohydrate-binding family 9-like protein [Planctomycetales bacterium]